MAKQQQDGAGAAGGLAGMPNLEGMDMESIQKMMEEAMKDPSLAAMNANMAEAMEQLGKMSPEELRAQMMEGLQQLTSGDIMDNVLGKKDEVLETLAAQGLVPADKIAEYRANPAKVRGQCAQEWRCIVNIYVCVFSPLFWHTIVLHRTSII